MWWIFRASVLPTYRKIKVSRAQVDCFPTCCADRGFAPRTPRVNHRHAFLLAKCVNVNPMFDVDYEYLTTTTQPLSLPSKIVDQYQIYTRRVVCTIHTMPMRCVVVSTWTRADPIALYGVNARWGYKCWCDRMQSAIIDADNHQLAILQ